MQTLQKGKFFGTSKEQYYINGITIVNSSFYNFTDCPWHYHSNAHFAFTTKGTLTETHKRRKINLSPGCLMFNHSQEPHCNHNYSQKVAALHIDIAEDWFHEYDIPYLRIEGVQVLENPLLKENFIKIFKEIKSFDKASPLSIESLLLQSVNTMLSSQKIKFQNKPAWVNKLTELLYAKCCEHLSLTSVALDLNIHPVYLCQQFPILFRCSFGEYIRKLRIEKAICYMLSEDKMSLTQIAYACAFADQSHFIRVFKNNLEVTPLVFKKYLG